MRLKKICAGLAALTMMTFPMMALTEGVATPSDTEQASEPIKIEVPVLTEAPVVTEAPVLTAAPAMTDAPVLTEAPVVTDAPAATQAPDKTGLFRTGYGVLEDGAKIYEDRRCIKAVASVPEGAAVFVSERHCYADPTKDMLHIFFLVGESVHEGWVPVYRLTPMNDADAAVLAAGMQFTATAWFDEAKQYPLTTLTLAEIATAAPQATETPAPTEAPEVTKAPEATEAPEVTEAPELTEAPEVTEAPELTEAPEVTEAPELTEAPEVTEAPELTEAPEVTEAPELTEAPEVTEAPETTEAPEMAETPELTETPEVAETPELTETPEVTETPELTEAPEATETPAPTETPIIVEETPAAETVATGTDLAETAADELVVRIEVLNPANAYFTNDEITLLAVVESAETTELHYQWEYAAADAPDVWVTIEGANADTFTFQINQGNSDYQWRVVVTRANEVRG